MITISPKKTAIQLFFVVIGLTVASLIGTICQYRFGLTGPQRLIALFNVNEEANLPTWYSTFSLLACSVLIALIAAKQRNQGDRFTRHWQILSFVFLFLSVDELASIHELSVNPLRNALHTGGMLYFAWVIPYSLLLLIFGLNYLKFIAHLPAKTRWLFVLAGGIYVGGALGMELIGGAYASAFDQHNLGFQLLSTIEEVFEMVGVIVFIYALLDYLRSYVQDVQLVFSQSKRGLQSEHQQTAKAR